MSTQQRAIYAVELLDTVSEIHNKYVAARSRGALGIQLADEERAYAVLKRDYDGLSSALSRTKSQRRSISNWYRARALQRAAMTYIDKTRQPSHRRKLAVAAQSSATA